MVNQSAASARILIAALALLTYTLPTSAEERCQEWAARLESVEGLVEWQSPDTSWQSAESGFHFCYGDRVRVVRERAALRLANDTLVRLQENSLVTLLPEEKGFWFSLREGAAHFLSRTPKQFTIKAPYLNAAVDGTEFVVNANPTENRVAVLEGDVRVSNELGEVHLGEGTQTTATANSAPSPVQSIRLRDAAEWILHYPPLIVQVAAPADIETLIREENYGEALSRLTAQDPTPETSALAASIAFNTGHTELGEQLLTNALKAAPGQADAQALRALRTLISGDSESALAQTTQLVESHPQNPSTLLAHAYALQSRGKIEEALQTNLKAQALVPDNLFALARSAELQLSVGNTRAAQKLIDRALKQAPNHSRVNTLAGFIALNRFDTGKAQNHFQTAIAINNSEPLARLGLALALIQKGKIDQGRAQMEMAVLLDPGNSLLRSYLGKTYATQNQNDWADAQYQLAKNLDPNDPTPWFYEGLKKQQTGELISAVKSFEKSRELNDNRAVYRSRLYLDKDSASRAANVGRVYNALGFSKQAIEIGAKAISEAPGEHSGHRLLAEAYAEDNRYESLRASERFQSTILQPIGSEPLPLGLSETGLLVINGAGPADLGVNEYNPLFVQEGLRGKGAILTGAQNTHAYDVSVGGFGKKIGFDIGHYNYKSDGFRENNDVNYSISNLLTRYQIDKVNISLEINHRSEEAGDLGLNFNPDDYSPDKRISSDSHRARLGANIQTSKSSVLLMSYSNNDIRGEEKGIIDFGSGPTPTWSKDDADVEAIEAVYIIDSENFSLVTGANQSEHAADTWDPMSSMTLFEANQQVSEYYLYIRPRAFEKLSLAFGFDYHDTDLDINVFGEDVTKKISSKVLPKVGLTWTPNNQLEGRIAYYETYSKRLEAQTSLKPTHFNGFPQVFDGAWGTLYESSSAEIIFRPSSSFAMGATKTHHDLTEPQIHIGNTAVLLDKQLDRELESIYINWMPNSKLSTGIRFENDFMDRETDPAEPDLTFPESHETRYLRLILNYSFNQNTIMNIKANAIRQTTKMETYTGQLSSSREDFSTVDASLQFILENGLGAIKLDILNITDREFSFTDYNIFATKPRSQWLVPERFGLLTITINMN
jgi:tetratricopeptide (TPR) repeat protein